MDAIARNEARSNAETWIRNFISLLPPSRNQPHTSVRNQYSRDFGTPLLRRFRATIILKEFTPTSPRLKTHSLDQRHQLFVFPLQAPRRDFRILFQWSPRASLRWS